MLVSFGMAKRKLEMNVSDISGESSPVVAHRRLLEISPVKTRKGTKMLSTWMEELAMERQH